MQNEYKEEYVLYSTLPVTAITTFQQTKYVIYLPLVYNYVFFLPFCHEIVGDNTARFPFEIFGSKVNS